MTEHEQSRDQSHEHPEETSTHADGWIRVKVPLPFSLRYVNAYLIPGPDGYTLVDPGLRTTDAEAVWERTLRRYRIDARDIVRILLTHQHPDHYGLAGTFQALSGAPVLMSERAHAYAVRLWGPDRTFAAELESLYIANGMPREVAARMEEHLESFVDRVSPQPAVTHIREGGTIAFGGGEWEIIHTPGHADGHLCYYRREKRLMLCGDQVLPDITPNVSVVPGDPPGVLGRFLAGLDKLTRYEVDMAFPGHRNPFADMAGRIRELQAHHARRLDGVAAMLEAPLTGYDVCESMFGARIAGNTHNLRFAMSEALAHLEHLALTGRASAETGADGVVRYRRAAR